MSFKIIAISKSGSSLYQATFSSHLCYSYYPSSSNFSHYLPYLIHVVLFFFLVSSTQVVFFFCFCQNEAIIYQVYNLPWFYLSPSQRKTVYIFLTYVQRPIAFKAFKIYPINLTTIPAVLRFAYSYIHVLTALVRR